MPHWFSDHQLALFGNFVKTRTALHFPPGRWKDLDRQGHEISLEMGFNDSSPFLRWLLTSPLSTEHQEILASHLNISETYFWRDPPAFEALLNDILPAIIRAREGQARRMRIWSAGCSSGEEPYSMAIALHRLLQDPASWNITILANDINPRILRKASAGIYGKWSFRSPPTWFRDYFHRLENEQYEVLPKIRKMVTFGVLNLAAEIDPTLGSDTNGMDIIFCRNVLMYLAPERAHVVAQRLASALVDGGWLIVSGSELSDHLFPQFTPVPFPGAILYQKNPTRVVIPESFPSLVLPLPDALPFPREREGGGISHHLEEIRVLANQGKLREALNLCRQGILRDKLDPLPYFLQATILLEQNNPVEAMASFRRAIYLDPRFVLAHFGLGNLLLRQGQDQAAKKSFGNIHALLAALEPDDILPESDGLTAGSFRKFVQGTMGIAESP
jgi:chemotaxis protein methyltransferase CheR